MMCMSMNPSQIPQFAGAVQTYEQLEPLKGKKMTALRKGMQLVNEMVYMIAL